MRPALLERAAFGWNLLAAMSAPEPAAAAARRKTSAFTFDEVDGLGTFLELEAVVDAVHDDARCREQVATLMTAFRIGVDDLVRASYADVTPWEESIPMAIAIPTSILPTPRRNSPSGVRPGLDLDDLHQVSQAGEVVGVASVQRKPRRQRRCRDQQVGEASAPGLASGTANRCVDLPVGSRGGGVEGERVERCLDALQSVLAACTLPPLVSRVRARRQLRKAHG
jgi:hypothetical protein